MDSKIEEIKKKAMQRIEHFVGFGNSLDNISEKLRTIADSGKHPIDKPICIIQATLLYTACCFCNETDTIEYLLSKGANPNIPDIHGFSPIMGIMFNEVMDTKTRCDAIKLLIDYGAYVNHLSSFGITAIEMAIEDKNLEVAELLYENGAIIFSNVETDTAMEYFKWLAK